MKTLKNVMLTLAFGMIIALSTISNTSAQPLAQTTPATVAPISVTATPVSAPTLTYDQALDTYSRISSEVVGVSKDTVGLAQWILTIIAGLAGFATIILTYIGTQTRSSRAAAQQSASSAENAAKSAAESREKLEKLQAEIQESTRQLQESRQELEVVRKQIKHIQPSNIMQLATFADVQNYRIKLFSGADGPDQIASATLIEYSRDNDPVIRLEVAEIFRALSNYPKKYQEAAANVIDRLHEMAEYDDEAAIRMEATQILKMLNVSTGKSSNDETK